MAKSKLVCRLVACVLLATVVGCNNSGRVSVTGRITRTDGSPVVGARVVFRSPTTGKSASGVTDGDGKYELGVEAKGDGIPPGEYGVAISEDLGGWDSPKSQTIHPKYASPKSSELTYVVEPGGATTYDLQLDLP